MKTIVICDDDQTRVREWVAALQQRPEISESYKVLGLEDGRLEPVVQELANRRQESRAPSTTQTTKNVIDDASILIVDYDLPILNGVITGEYVAYLARCYSTCGLIVALNQFKSENPFDLTLRDHPESFADLNIGSKQLDNAGLWSRTWKGFRPWAWPVLPEAEAAYARRVVDVRDHLGSEILTHLGITPAMASSIPREAREYLSPTAPIDEITFLQFTTQSGQGLKAKDVVQSDDATARIAAARVSRWIECFLLPRQDILIDGPHLALRFPSLLEGDHTNKETWNTIARSTSSESTGLSDVLKPALFNPMWSSRPCWDWTSVSSNEEVKEVKDPWLIERPNFVFAEDLSSFIPETASREFLAAFGSPFSRRHLANPNSGEIEPEVRAQLSQVEYRPKDRLFL